MHLLSKENLKECFYRLQRSSAAGVDETSWHEYESNLEENLESLVARMKQWSYRPQPVKRTYIPKGNGKLRPLGIPAVEDKIVQMAVTRILETIFLKKYGL